MLLSELKTALNSGELLHRNWWEEGKFIFAQVPSCIPKEVVPKMQSLPEKVKAKFVERFNDPEAKLDGINYSNQYAVVNKENSIQGWNPTAEDLIAEDWEVYTGK